MNKIEKCQYCDITNKEIVSTEWGKSLPNCEGDRNFFIIYKDWGDKLCNKHLLISDGRRGGYYRPKYCPECGRKLF